MKQKELDKILADHRVLNERVMTDELRCEYCGQEVQIGQKVHCIKDCLKYLREQIELLQIAVHGKIK